LAHLTNTNSSTAFNSFAKWPEIHQSFITLFLKSISDIFILFACDFSKWSFIEFINSK
jgi:hypothetical protein